MKRWAVLLGLISGCALHPPLVKTIEGDWASSLDGDLRVAAAHSSAYFKDNGWPIELRWAGVRGSTYAVERGPTGVPIRESVQLLYAFYYPKLQKCFLSYQAQSAEYEVRLARENTGGGSYGPPSFIGFAPLRGDGDPIGPEVVCSAIDQAQGGVHVGQGQPETAAAPPVVHTQVAVEASASESPDDALAKLDSTLPAPCIEYTKLTCLNPNLPAHTDRAQFCSKLVERANRDDKKPNAEKSCRAQLKNRR